MLLNSTIHIIILRYVDYLVLWLNLIRNSILNNNLVQFGNIKVQSNLFSYLWFLFFFFIWHIFSQIILCLFRYVIIFIFIHFFIRFIKVNIYSIVLLKFILFLFSLLNWIITSINQISKLFFQILVYCFNYKLIWVARIS